MFQTRSIVLHLKKKDELRPHLGLVWMLSNSPQSTCVGVEGVFCAYALTLPPIGFALRSVQTHISKQFRIEMCVCTFLKANPMGGRVRAYALKGKINFTLEWIGVEFSSSSTPIHTNTCGVMRIRLHPNKALSIHIPHNEYQYPCMSLDCCYRRTSIGIV